MIDSTQPPELTEQEVEEIGADLDKVEPFRWAPEDMDLDDPSVYALSPSCDTVPREFRDRFVDYNLRGPRDVVLSGPVQGGTGPGRYHQNRRRAYYSLVDKYGADRVRWTEKQSYKRWSFLVRGLKCCVKN